jgi:hypothetical protein
MGLLTFGNRRRARVVCNGAQSGPRSGNFQLVRFSVARTAAWSLVEHHRLGGWFAARAVVARSGVRAPSRGPALRVVTSRSSSPHPQGQVVLVKTMRYNHAVHTDAREAWFFFRRTPLARAGDRGRSAP